MEEITPVIEKNQRLDLLDRQEFVDRMLTIANALSDRKKNACYAVNGDWGVGKSFVLDMFEEQAKNIGIEGEELSRYLIFRYNCWEYDYYEEPLVAMVASMLDQIDEKVDLISTDVKTKTVAVLKAVGKGLAQKATQVIEDKTGIDLQSVFETAKDGCDAVEKRVKESHEYDQFFDFKKNIKTLRETISSLSKDQTILFVVDELDRCLPEYTIKVLERLHHLFNDIPNVQVVLSMDIGQLEHVVKQIYGPETNTEKYLKKYVGFQLGLDTGILNDEYNNYFSEYTSCFGELAGLATYDDVKYFVTTILDGVDMRSRISILEKCHLIHTTFFAESKYDLSYLCMELLLVVLDMFSLDCDYANQHFSIEAVFAQNKISRTNAQTPIPRGLSTISNLYKENKTGPGGHYKIFYYDHDQPFINIEGFWGIILSVYRALLGFDEDRWAVGSPFHNSKYDSLQQLIKHTKDFWVILSSIK